MCCHGYVGFTTVRRMYVLTYYRSSFGRHLIRCCVCMSDNKCKRLADLLRPQAGCCRNSSGSSSSSSSSSSSGSSGGGGVENSGVLGGGRAKRRLLAYCIPSVLSALPAPATCAIVVCILLRRCLSQCARCSMPRLSLFLFFSPVGNLLLQNIASSSVFSVFL